VVELYQTPGMTMQWRRWGKTVLEKSTLVSNIKERFKRRMLRMGRAPAVRCTSKNGMVEETCGLYHLGGWLTGSALAKGSK
jgi:hypothetical protein